MIRPWMRIACLALLGLIGAAAASGVAKASTPRAHACCERPAPERATPDAAACRGFLPLSCCQAPALPAGDPAALAPVAALRVAIALPPRPLARLSPAEPVLGPPLPPSRLSVVLQL